MAIRKKVIECYFCDQPVSKDEKGLNQKLLPNDAKNKKFRCINCMAEYLECTVEDLEYKIEEFKNEGCTLFK